MMFIASLVPKVTLRTRSSYIPKDVRAGCKIGLRLIAKDGSAGQTKTGILFENYRYRKYRFSVNSHSDYFLRGEATFTFTVNEGNRAPPGGLRYIWKVNGKNMSSNKTFRHIFNETGSYIVGLFAYFKGRIYFLAAKNVSVRDQLTKLEIFVSSLRYFGEPVLMQAKTNINNNVNYYWDFGDGKQKQTPKNIVEHRYKKPGTYTVQVVANNKVSEIYASETFNATELCPDGGFETSFEDGKEVQQFRSKPIHLEISTRKLVCLEPVTIFFGWTVSKWTDERAEWREWINLKSNISTKSIFIPPNILAYGKYRFIATVNITGFHVLHSQTFSMNVSVTRSPVYAIIRGGFIRHVKTNSTFLLDATPSFDPEDLNTDLKFEWSFPGVGKRKNQAVIELDSKSLNQSTEFKLKVYSGNRKNETSQHIIIQKSQEVKANMILDCPSCDLGLNPSQPTRIMEKCSDGVCPSQDKMLWKLFELRNEYGDPKLDPIFCSGFDQPFSLNNGSKSKVSYKFHVCGNEKATATMCKELKKELGLFCTRSTKEIELAFRRKDQHSEMLDIEDNTFPANKVFTIKRIDDKISDNVLAERSFIVQNKPRNYSCFITPTKGVELFQDFQITCGEDKNARLVYKIVYQRGGSIPSNIFFQRKIPQFKFNLPSGEVKNSIKILIENENGVARVYCDIDVTVTTLLPGQNTTNNVVEYLYNRSMTVNDCFAEHPYAYHGQTLYNITLISDILNRQRVVSTSANLFLRTRIREILIDILRRVTISDEYIARQFASSLDSCTRVSEELSNNSLVAVVEIIHKLMIRKRHGIEQKLKVTKRFEEHILTVIDTTSSILVDKFKNKEHDEKIMESINNLFESKLRTMFVRSKMNIINIKKNIFSASVFKFSPYRSEKISFLSGKTRVTLETISDKDSQKQYECDLFGCGFQAITVNNNPFRDDVRYQKVSSLTKLTTNSCKHRKKTYCAERIRKTKISFPLKVHNVMVKSNTQSLKSTEIHVFTVKQNRKVLKVHFVPVSYLSRKMKLRVQIRCADARYRYVSSSEFIFFINNDPFVKFLSAKSFSEKCKNLNVTVEIHWIVEPTRSESLQTKVKYNLDLVSLDCLVRSGNEAWSENLCECDLDHSPYYELNCRCPKLQSSDHSYVIVEKRLPASMKKTIVKSNENDAVNTVIQFLSLFYVVVVIVLFIKERLDYKTNMAIPLERSNPTHTHQYKITVYTGHCCGAGTTARVAVVLYGDNNSSYPIELFTENRQVFNRNSRDVFVVSVQENLGSLNCIHLWHDNSGSSPSWFVDKLVIKDLCTKQKWLFKCRRWLAVDKHDKMLDCKIEASTDPKTNFSFKELRLGFGEKLMDFHIWLSVISMPTYSLFTRAERVTCCMTLLFAYLFFNAYFYEQYGEYVIPNGISVFNPTWSQLKVGLFSTLSCFPIYLVFTAVFRYTKSFVHPQIEKSAIVDPQPDTHKPSATDKYDRLVSEMERSPVDSRRRKQFELAALLLKTLYDEDDPASDSEQLYAGEESSAETTSISRTRSSDRPSVKVQKRANVELSSDTSGSWLTFSRPIPFRFPTFFSILMWIGCIVMLLLSSMYTIEHVKRFEEARLRCYIQSVFWSLFLSIVLFQPFHVLIVTFIEMMKRHFHSTMIEEPADKAEDDTIVDDSMFGSFTEKNFEDPLYRKLLCLKYLQPLSSKVVAKARRKLHRRKITVTLLRDFFLYSLLMIFLYCLNPFWNQESIFVHNNRLNTYLNRHTNTSSLLAWWSSCPQKFLDTITLDEETLTLRAFHKRDLIVGHPKMSVTLKYCPDVNISDSTLPQSHCIGKVVKKAFSFNESQDKDWLGLSHFFHQEFDEYTTTDISLQFVIHSPPLAVFTAIRLSSRVISPSSRVQNDVRVTTANFHVISPGILSFQTILQLFYTMVPVLLLLRQVFYSNKKTQYTLVVKIEFLIVFLSIYSVVSMWIWIKQQYLTLGILWEHQYEANIVEDIQAIYKYQEFYKYSIAFMLLFVIIKICHAGFDMFCGALFGAPIISSVILPLFGLLLIFVAFAHAGLLLFGDHLKMFSSFLQAFSLNILYMRKNGAENFKVEPTYHQMLLAVYVIAFCVWMMLFSNLVKAAFCQARVKFSLIVKTKSGRMPVKLYILRKLRRVYSRLMSCVQKSDHEDEHETFNRVPMSYVFRELGEQLDDIEFRLTHLTCKANMPAKDTRDGSSDGSDVEYVYKDDNNEHSTFHPGLSSNIATSFSENENNEDLKNSKGVNDQYATCEETVMFVTPKPRRPFERSVRAFPTLVNETFNSSERPQVILSPWFGENDDEDDRQTTLGQQEDFLAPVGEMDCKINGLGIAQGERSVPFHDIKEYNVKTGGSTMKNKKNSLKVASYVNEACEEDVREVCGNLTAKRPNVHLDAFEDYFSLEEEDCCLSKTESVEQSLVTSLETEHCLDENVHTVGTISDRKQLISRRKPFRQPPFPPINDLFTRPSEKLG
ncbi:polycystic kidney disease 1-related protein-like isoform X2 [Dendronephthya gigantea]|uniref:polycystic kidney disease 1-related protein-like isoform X2 n=1 Tax=Dendronephthya gigantea TaxID=151771 RepID=UPI001069E647|nr:polycystic kidney disease 1-related protein-like isoform X2 [Dendronephthya gigantea]